MSIGTVSQSTIIQTTKTNGRVTDIEKRNIGVDKMFTTGTKIISAVTIVFLSLITYIWSSQVKAVDAQIKELKLADKTLQIK